MLFSYQLTPLFIFQRTLAGASLDQYRLGPRFFPLVSRGSW